MKHRITEYFNINFKNWHLLILASLLCASCEEIENGVGNDTHASGMFLTTSGCMDSGHDTRSDRMPYVEAMGGMTAQVSVSDWDANPSVASRSAVIGDEIEWRNTPELSIYITDATSSDNTLIARNLAINPQTHVMYETYYGKPSKDGDGTAIGSSKFFWDADWSHKGDMKERMNFYGFYPRPTNSVLQGALDYVRNSIVLQEDAAGQSGQPWNLLHYAFIDQTDENMSWHDVMCSIPEEEGIRYGNQNKTEGSNIQLHYKHMFSLLDIEVNKGTKYRGDCVISSMVLSGTQVFTEGTLDILKGSIAPVRGTGDQEVKIARIFDAQKITEDSPFHKTVIVQPTQDGDNPNDDGRLVLTCCIDGVNYSCSFPTLRLESGKRYKLKLTLTPAGVVVFKIWSGAKVEVGGQELSPEDSGNEITPKAERFAVKLESGYRLVDVLKNGKSILGEVENGEYQLERNEYSNTNYNVVTCKADDWYVTDGLRLHYDGIKNQYNSSSDAQNKNLGIWYDLSGNDNDGTLRSFTTTSGWNGKGLVFDGLDDLVYFSGKITPSYTMEFYLCVEPTQRGAHPRFVAEGNRYPCFYFYGTSSKYDGVYTSTDNSRQMAFFDIPNKSLGTTIVTDGIQIIQLDFAYDSETHILTWYVDGEEKGHRENVADPESIDIASIGNRYVDNSRALAATYYSFMIYNRALTQPDITQNYNINKTRYGTTK